MKKFYLFIFCIASVLGTTAQNKASIKGIVFDSLSAQPISNATITLLEKSDSSLVSFTMADDNGNFEFKNLRDAGYRLLITHTGYKNLNRIVTVTPSNRIIDLEKICIGRLGKTLSEIVIEAESPPVTLINDTVQYNAGSFKTAPNANVEQLLKKLPGVKVDKDGTIKAQGETVNRVLVDGKEFFGNDPKVATKNLPADAIDKVQVYDRQSEQAQLTGFDDGNYEKTINLKLKKDKKKGMFGKVSAGAGNTDRYESRFNVNSFKGARQLSALAMANNTNAEGFSFMDILNFTGELARMQRSGGGNLNINMSDNDIAALGIGVDRNTGIRTVWGAGVNYNNIIGNKIDLQSNFFSNHYNPNNESWIKRQYFIPGSFYFYDQHSMAKDINNNQRVNLNLLYQIDSSNSIRITPSFNYQKTNNRSENNYQTQSATGKIINDGFGNNTLSNQGYNFKNELLYRRKLNRRGRTLSLSLQTSINKSKGDGSLSSINNFYDSIGSLFRKDTLNQVNNTAADLRGYTARLAYTEPVLKRSLLEFSIGKSYTSSRAEKQTYDFNDQTKLHDQLNSYLTNDFENIFKYVNAGIRMRTQKKKYNYSFGAVWQQATLEGNLETTIKDSVIKRTFDNILPTARFQYNFSRFKSFSINYITSTNQPDISQLQPVPDNSNSLNIKKGNPSLQQEYQHALRANLNLLSPYKNKNLFVMLSVQSTKNKIVNSDSIDQYGIKTTTPVNADGLYAINGNISYSMPVPFMHANFEISNNFNFNKGKQFINGIANQIKSVTIGPEIRLEFNPHRTLNISAAAALNIYSTKYSLLSSLNTKYLQQQYSSSVDWEMPKRFFLSSDFTYTINSQRSTGFNSKIPLWNASLSKMLLRYNRGEVKLSAIDILNRNIGINRNSNQNYIEDSRVKTLRQFFMVSFTYSLNKTGLNNQSSGGMRVISR